MDGNNKVIRKFNFTELKDYLYYYTNLFNDSMSQNNSLTYKQMGPIRIRFLRLNYLHPCPNNLDINPVNVDTPQSVFI